MGIYGTPSIHEAMLELPQRGVNRVLSRPPSAVRHHVYLLRDSRYQVIIAVPAEPSVVIRGRG